MPLNKETKTNKTGMEVCIYQALRNGRVWHKVNFQEEFNRFEFRIFLS